jgi:hypothetical protein
MKLLRLALAATALAGALAACDAARLTGPGGVTSPAAAHPAPPPAPNADQVMGSGG